MIAKIVLSFFELDTVVKLIVAGLADDFGFHIESPAIFEFERHSNFFIDAQFFFGSYAYAFTADVLKFSLYPFIDPE